MLNWQSSEVSTLSLVAPFILKLLKACAHIEKKTEFVLVRSVSRKMAQLTKEKFSCLNDLIYSLATFLDPRTKHLFQDLPSSFQQNALEYVKEFASIPKPEEDARISKKRKLHSIADDEEDCTAEKEILADNSGEASELESAFDGFIDEMFENKKISLPSEFDLKEYLDRHFSPESGLTSWFSSLPPYFKELFLCICGIPAASSESERLFSVSGYINSKSRSSMLSVCTFFFWYLTF
jgi:hypothetical protein